MPDKKPDAIRILSYVTGLLYFYGAVDFERLYRVVSDCLADGLSRQNFKDILDQSLAAEDRPYDFYCDDGLYCHESVVDAPGVLAEQAKRGELPYRPVPEKEALMTLQKQFQALWHPAVNELNRYLQDRLGWSRHAALAKILQSQNLLRNGMPPMELIQFFLNDTAFESFDEIQPFIDKIMAMANHTPLWDLKGWTPHEVFERYEKSKLKPLPATPFGLKDITASKGMDKVGRNEPCPCGSGKKYKKCCAAIVPEENNLRTVAVEVAAPANRKKPPPRENPTFQEWGALYEAAVSFQKARCWEWMYNEDLFGVMDPETGEIVYCCIMGFLGELFALGAYLGPEGLEPILSMLEQEDPSADFFFSQKCLMASFEDREVLADEDRAVIKELGLKFRGKKQWPLFRSYEPGLYPWFISAWECRLLTFALREALAVSLRCREDKSILEGGGPRTFLVRVPRKEKGEITWADRYLEAAPPVRVFVSPEITDELRLKKILNSRKKGRATWEIDTFLLPFPVQEKTNERPYYPKAFLILDSTKGLILRHQLVQNLAEEGHRCIEAMLALLEDNNMALPARIAVERDETYRLLEKTCRRLSVSLVKVPQLEFMPRIREEMASDKIGFFKS